MPKTLLLADDSVTIQRVIELTFAQEDVRVVSVGDGRQAVEWCERDVPDVVLADVDVPGVDGYALTEFIKQTPRLRHVPVLLLAGAFEPVDQDRVSAAGCDGVLVKPFEPQQLVSRVHALLERAVAPGAPRPDGTEGRVDEAASIPQATSTGFESVRLRPDAPAPAAVAASAGVTAPVQAKADAAPRVSLVSAFSALLAAEQSSAPPAAPVPASTPITEATVEDAVRRVLLRMTDDLVRRIVLETAERLIKEEIEKIKANPE
jgi:CheY-like chemotaxis protein